MMPNWLYTVWTRSQDKPLNLPKAHMVEIVKLLRDPRAHDVKLDWIEKPDYFLRFAVWEVLLEGAWWEFVKADPKPWPDDYAYPIRMFLDNSISYITQVQSKVKTKNGLADYRDVRINDVDTGTPEWLSWAKDVLNLKTGWHLTHGDEELRS